MLREFPGILGISGRNSEILRNPRLFGELISENPGNAPEILTFPGNYSGFPGISGNSKKFYGIYSEGGAGFNRASPQALVSLGVAACEFSAN